MSQTPKPWQRLSRTLLQKTIVFDLYVDKLRSPRNGKVDDFYLIDVVDWVNIIALTPERNVLFVEQYRFGAEQTGLELPGGMLGSREEDPLSAAQRELEEETGYHATEIEYLGWAHPNPAIQTNKCHFYFSQHCSPSGTFQQDALEDIVVHQLPLSEVLSLIATEQISHALMVTAFMKLIAKQGPELLCS